MRREAWPSWPIPSTSTDRPSPTPRARPSTGRRCATPCSTSPRGASRSWKRSSRRCGRGIRERRRSGPRTITVGAAWASRARTSSRATLRRKRSWRRSAPDARWPYGTASPTAIRRSCPCCPRPARRPRARPCGPPSASSDGRAWPVSSSAARVPCARPPIDAPYRARGTPPRVVSSPLALHIHGGFMRFATHSLAVLALAAALPAAAEDLTIVSKVTRDGGPPTTTTSYISSDHARFAQAEGQEAILDLGTGTTTVIDGRKKEYFVITPQDWEQMRARMDQMMNSPEMKRAQEQMKNLPPDVQKRMQSIRGGMASEVEVQKPGTTRQHAG